MLFLIIFFPLINFFIFLIFGRIISCKRLAMVVIANMIAMLGILLALAPAVISGKIYSASLGA
jgi:NADH:ubiquinone oxidoreductase subunit 5 (subunit L)/multisubunit Na+/H+ antiporter MnhA subunit